LTEPTWISVIGIGIGSMQPVNIIICLVNLSARNDILQLNLPSGQDFPRQQPSSSANEAMPERRRCPTARWCQIRFCKLRSPSTRLRLSSRIPILFAAPFSSAASVQAHLFSLRWQ